MSDEYLNLGPLRAALDAAFPHLCDSGMLAVLGEGFRGTVLGTEHYVFRIARDSTVAAGQRLEAQLLACIRDRLPLPVPEQYGHAGPSAHFPFGVAAYRRLPGVSLTPTLFDRPAAHSVAQQIGSFLAALHSIPVEELKGLELASVASRRERWQRLRTNTSPVLRAAMRPDEYAAIELWWDRFLADPLLDDFTAVLCHGDLWYENVLVMPDGLVSGVVDWEAVAVDDPVQDFVPLLYLGEVFTADVRAAYEEAGGRLGFSSAHRLRQLSALREFGGVQHAARHDDMAELADSVEKLRRGPILRYKTGS